MIIDRTQSKVTRDELISICHKASIEVRPTWKPLHMQKVFQEKQIFGGFVSENLFHDGLCLPSGSNLSNKDREKVISTLLSALI